MKTAFRVEDNITRIPAKLSDPKELDSLMEKIGDSKFVLLGEASHGTHEYYTWRTEISKRLIQEKGFSFIAVEGDWPDCYKINRFIKGYKNSGVKIFDVLNSFNRWPTWMWANWEIAALSEWLLSHNAQLSQDKKIGFYGLDVYSLWESMNAIITFLEKKDPVSAQVAKRAIQCFEPFKEEGSSYARATALYDISCKKEVLQLLMTVLNTSNDSGEYIDDKEAEFNAEQNAFVALNAEKYYRSMISFGPESWNIRDRHMADTLNRLINFHGSNSKAIIWEHNTHIGDARATDMKDEGMWNVGQLVREEHKEEGVFLIGFGSYEGSVIAGAAWGAPMETFKVPPALRGSLENLLHQEFQDDYNIFILKNSKNERFDKFTPHRAIGVVYNPLNEKSGNYVPTILSKRYDAFIYLDYTMALHPLHLKPNGHITPDTYPFGL